MEEAEYFSKMCVHSLEILHLDSTDIHNLSKELWPMKLVERAWWYA
jgi:hypothetical protein